MAQFARPPCDDGVIEGHARARGAEAGTAPQSPASGKWVLAATILGSSMVFIDGSVVNVALPAIQDDLNATSAQIQWVVESYALFLAALVLIGGALGDFLGRKIAWPRPRRRAAWIRIPPPPSMTPTTAPSSPASASR